MYLCFIDYSKAFDKVKHSGLFDILLRHNCDGKDLRVIRNLYWEQEATIRIDDDCSAYKPICRGVRLGCVFSPDLFNIYSEIILRNIKHHEGVRVEGNNINNLRYADGTVLIATIFGHINRADGLEKQILSEKIYGTKSKGRQRTKYTDSLNNSVTRKESPNNELIRRTDDREGWKAMIADVCNRPGT